MPNNNKGQKKEREKMILPLEGVSKRHLPTLINLSGINYAEILVVEMKQ